MTIEIPEAAQVELRNAFNAASSPIQPLMAQRLDLGEYRAKGLEVLDTVLGAIDTVQSYSWLLPAQHRSTVEAIEKALRKIRSWLD